MPTVNRPSLAATLSLSAVVASIFSFAPASNAQTAVSQDPTIVTSASNLTAPASYGTISTGAAQYFANGATFPAVVLRNLLDFYGVAIPGTQPNLLQIGSQGTQPFNSPRNNFQQFNYAGTGSGNGRATFTGTALVSNSASYVAFTTTQFINPKAVVNSVAGVLPGTGGASPGVPAGNIVPAVPAGGADHTFTAYPTFPTGNIAGGSPAPLFAFGDSNASTSGLGAGDITAYTTNKQPTRGPAIQIPVFFGAVVPAFNAGINGGATPALTNDQLCRIFDRQFTDYSQIGLAAGPINLALRQDNSGTTSIFTGYLASICNSLGVVTPGFTSYYITATTGTFPTAALIGPLNTVPNPVVPGAPGVVRRNGNDGVSDYVATTSGGHGYAEASFVQPVASNAPITPNTPAPIQARLQNSVSGSFLTANLNAVRAALTNVSLTPNATYPCVLTVSGLPVAPTVGTAYPIVGQTYLFAYTNYPLAAQTNAMRGAFNYILGNRTTPISSNDQITQGQAFILLGTGTANNTINPLRAQARACINSIKTAVGPI